MNVSLSDAPPQILALQIPSTTVFGGETFNCGVVASSNVASVEIRAAGYSQVMQKVAPGRFTAAITVPRLPFFLRKTYTIDVIARNSEGDATSATIPITVR
jgi:hypothetical protein